MLHIFTFCFEEDITLFYNELKTQEKQTNGKIFFNTKKVFTISRKLSKTYFVSANTFQKKPDNPTELLVWKISLHEMENYAINILVHKSIEKIW